MDVLPMNRVDEILLCARESGSRTLMVWREVVVGVHEEEEEEEEQKKY